MEGKRISVRDMGARVRLTHDDHEVAQHEQGAYSASEGGQLGVGNIRESG